VSETKESADALALRASPRPVTRLNRRTIAGVVGVLAAALSGATIWSLQWRSSVRDAPIELHNVERITHADGLEQLPPDYSKVATNIPAANSSPAPPLLGSPLPGDLGGPLLRAEQQAALSSGQPILHSDAAADAARVERINRLREAEEAAKAQLFFHTEIHDAAPGTPPTPTATGIPSAIGEARPTAAAGAAQNKQDEKRTFVEPPGDTGSISTHRLQSPSSPYQIVAGTVIAGALITGINSDLPGQVLATVTEPVYDSATGRHLLIPQGSRLLGQYDSQVTFGQRRVLMVWTRLVLPDASSIALDRLPGVDAAGYAGLQDDVDSHWQQLVASAALSTLIGIGAELAAPDRSNGQNEVVIATRQGLQDSVNQVGQELTRRSLNVQPTVTVRPGFPVRVIVNKDLVLRPYQPLFFERKTP
jgi:type IV secretion system protein TrbI